MKNIYILVILFSFYSFANLPPTNQVVSTPYDVSALILDLSNSSPEKRLTAQKSLYQRALINPKIEGKLRMISSESKDSNMAQRTEEILDRMQFTRAFSEIRSIYYDDYEELKNSHSFDYKEIISNSLSIQQDLIPILIRGDNKREVVYILSKIKRHTSTERQLVRILYDKKAVAIRAQEVLLLTGGLYTETLMDLVTALLDSHARPRAMEILLEKIPHQTKQTISDMQSGLVLLLPNPETRPVAEKLLHSIIQTFAPQAQRYLITLLRNYQFRSQKEMTIDEKNLKNTIEELLKSSAQKNTVSALFIQKEILPFFSDHLVITDHLVDTLIAVLMEISKKYGLDPLVITKLKESTLFVDPYMAGEVEELLKYSNNKSKLCQRVF